LKEQAHLISTKTIEKQIDNLFYRIYNLDEEEINLISKCIDATVFQ